MKVRGQAPERARTRVSKIAWVAACGAAVVFRALPVAAQAPPVEISLPPTLLLPNYDRVQIGQREGLEGGAFVARSDDAAAGWYNPAGLALSSKSGLNASAVAYEWTTLGVEGLGQRTDRSSFGSISTLVAGVLGAPVIHSDRWRLGFSLTTPVAWHPSVVDDVFQATLPPGEERFSYASSVGFSSMIPALGAGFRARSALRLGASVAMPWTSLSQTQNTGDRYLSADSTVTRLRRFRSDGSTLSATFSASMQWDVTPKWTAGAIVTTPTARVTGQSLLVFEGSQFSGVGTSDRTFRDDEAKFEYRQPVRIAAGIARRFDRGSVEADLRFHGSTSDYAVISSPLLGRSVTLAPGGAPVVTDVSFRDSVHRAREVWNVAVGGRYVFTPHWTGHAGMYTDASPVADANSSLFRRVDLMGFTGGVTLAGEHLSGSLGLGYSFGDSDPVRLGTLHDGQVVASALHVSTFNLSYAVSYVF